MHVIYVDGERKDCQFFQKLTAAVSEMFCLDLFSGIDEALEWADGHIADVAFVALNALGEKGLDGVCELMQRIANIRVVLVAQDGAHALDAWNIGAWGYLIKPLTADQIRGQLLKCCYQPLPSQRVMIQTIPTLAVIIDGKPLRIAGGKPRELFALLVEYGTRGITTAEGIAFLWPDKENDAKTQSLFRMTYKRLVSALEEAGVGDIIDSRDNRRFLRVEKVNCDLYRILSGDQEAMKKYAGQYLQEYSWAEERNGQLYSMLMSN